MLCDRLGIFVDGTLVCIGNPKVCGSCGCNGLPVFNSNTVGTGVLLCAAARGESSLQSEPLPFGRARPCRGVVVAEQKQQQC